MSLSGRELNDGIDSTLAPLPIEDRGFPKFASVEKDMHRHDQAEVAHGDVHSSVSDLVIGCFVNERGQRATHGSSSPYSKTTEPGEDGLTDNNGKIYNGLTSLIRPTIVLS